MGNRLAFFEVEKWEKPFIRRAFKNHSLYLSEKRINAEDLSKIKDVDIISVFIYSRVDSSVIAKLPKLKHISTRSTGFDHIDLKACKKRKITVSNVPSYGENTVAEHTFALILSLSRNIHRTYVRTINNNFSLSGLRGFDLKDKTIGVVGAGRIGLHVIRMANGFGMHALAFDVRKDTFLQEVLRFKYVGLEELFRNSDIISLHAPLNEHTHHMINKASIKLFKKGAILINTSRGGLIDTESLIDALDSGILAGAGLDVLEGEQLLKEETQIIHEEAKRKTLKELILSQNLLSRENVVFTPHNAFNSNEAVARILNTGLSNIKAHLAGKRENIVEL